MDWTEHSSNLSKSDLLGEGHHELPVDEAAFSDLELPLHVPNGRWTPRHEHVLRDGEHPIAGLLAGHGVFIDIDRGIPFFIYS